LYPVPTTLVVLIPISPIPATNNFVFVETVASVIMVYGNNLFHIKNLYYN